MRRLLALFLLCAAPALAARPFPPAPNVADLKFMENPAGLQVADVTEGSGTPVAVGDEVEVEFILALEDGTVIDATWLRDGPFRIVAGSKGTIEGFSVGLVGMRPGGRRVIIVPPALGYGDEARGPIAAGSTLVFDVVLPGGSARVPPTEMPALEPGSFQVSATGLQYRDVVQGTGALATLGKRVRVEYTGWLRATGERFDSSLSRDVPLSIRLGAGEVIKGWEEGLRGMRVGGKRVLVIPPELAYGAQGRPGRIPPGSVLVFEVDLVGVE